MLKLSSSRSKPSTLLTLIHIQEALESEVTIVTKHIYIRIEALAQFLCLYSCNKNVKDFNPPEYLRALQKDLSQIYQLPKLKPICKRLESLAQRMETHIVTEESVTEEILGVMRDLVHSVSR
jgi:SPX domain protein involved in polyphosphate accumulation